nr:hypothetical protein [Tanacetum cinerariifolium]
EAEEPSSLQDAPPISNHSPSSLIASHIIDLDRPMPYTSHPPIGLLRIASMASLVSDVSVKKASRKVSTTGMRRLNFGTRNEQ